MLALKVQENWTISSTSLEHLLKRKINYFMFQFQRFPNQIHSNNPFLTSSATTSCANFKLKAKDVGSLLHFQPCILKILWQLWYLACLLSYNMNFLNSSADDHQMSCSCSITRQKKKKKYNGSVQSPILSVSSSDLIYIQS